MAFEKNHISLKSNGQAKRDFIWMGDVCKIIHKITAVPATHTTYNISGERTYAMIEVANAVQDAFEEWKGESLPLDINEEDKNEYKDDLTISSTKIKDLIAYDAKPHFKEEALKIFEFLSNQTR
jgi:UDP-glucose 4-epimerase